MKFYHPSTDDAYNPKGQLPDDIDYITLPLIPVDSSSYGTTIAGQEYSLVEDDFGNFKFEYYVDLPEYDPDTSDSMYNKIMKRGYFYHINPEIYWYGSGKLAIDYIVLEDEFARSIRLNHEDSEYLNRLDAHLNNIADPLENILYYYSKDEPLHGQLQIYQYLMNHLSNLNPPKKMITANFLSYFNTMKHNGKAYNHQKLFLDVVHPDRIMIDVYPLQWLTSGSWNTGDQTSPNFVQTKIDDMLHYYYYSMARNVLN
ncbi:MAG: hypothetical protein RBS43_02210 [Candidatus Cloacimonas sp.]|nr:hypothetical protein [Candidatus Cloacimonas sp.]